MQNIRTQELMLDQKAQDPVRIQPILCLHLTLELYSAHFSLCSECDTQDSSSTPTNQAAAQPPHALPHPVGNLPPIRAIALARILPYALSSSSDTPAPSSLDPSHVGKNHMAPVTQSWERPRVHLRVSSHLGNWKVPSSPSLNHF